MTKLEKLLKLAQEVIDLSNEAQEIINEILDNKPTGTRTFKVNHIVVSVRENPSKTAEIISHFSLGTEVQVQQIYNGWAKIEYKGYYAYIMSRLLIRVDDNDI